MNLDNLHELINRYEADIENIYGSEHDELFKWRAARCWQDQWNRPEDCFESFADHFNAARKEFGLFMDNSRMHPSTGVVKLWEKEPEAVERLFYEVLFSDDGGDISVRQDHMDAFVEGFEKLREEYYPGNWSYKHDRHSASVLLAVNNPESNYVYKSNNALKMAEYLDFGLRIGSGQTFSLQNYYKMCDGIVEALYQHDSLLEKHFNYLNDTHYHDESLHLLAFDLIYCSYCYNYYRGLVSFATGRTISKKTVQRVELSLEELERAEKEKQLKISELEKQIADAEKRCDEFEDISLIGVQVTAPKYGIGTVISQDVNKVTVCFNNTEKTFILDERFSARPRFENDEEIVHAFSQLARDKEELQILRKQLTDLL